MTHTKTASFSEETIINWTKPPSDTEETKLSNSERMVREAMQDDPTLSSKNIEIFGQGSYANDTNVRLNSDIDINVKYGDAFYYDLPKDSKKEDFGLVNHSTYSLQEINVLPY
jgi:tRNA nucleotidyltransferase (CCA-adding enzyme)